MFSAVTTPASRRIPELGLRTGGLVPLWQADQLARPALPGCASGFAELDAELPGGGWPAAGLTELLLRESGCGEIQLLAPALARLAEERPQTCRFASGPPRGLSQRGSDPSLTQAPRELVWIAPPYAPYAPALHALGLPLARLLWLQPASEADAAWAAEQVLRSGSAGAVLWWSRAALPATLRRLHLAAQDSSTPLFALRCWACRQQSSPAPLRLSVEPAAGARIRVHLIKRRGPSLARPLSLALPYPPFERRQSVIVIPFCASEDVVAGTAPALAVA